MQSEDSNLCSAASLAIGVDVGERQSVPTPAKDSTEMLLAAIADVVKKIPGDHAIGLAFPSVITRGTVRTAAHLNKDWIGQPLAALATGHLDRTVVAINDADAAGLAELQEMHALLWPDLIVLCGGITEEPQQFVHKLRCVAPLRVGALRSPAGIVGAAMATSLL